MLILAIAAIIALSSCAKQPNGVACTMEAKMCPDGSYVGRQGPNCEFAKCPKTENADKCNYGNPDKNYVGKSKDECSRIKFMCVQDKEYFSDECGCGCKVTDSIDVQIKCDVSECGPALGMPNYLCPDGKTSSGPTGNCLRNPDGTCGWEIADCPIINQNGSLKQNYCTPEQKKAEICTMDYNPVCGWFGENIQCIRYPCASTFSNSCGACQSENVAYWTEGECPA